MARHSSRPHTARSGGREPHVVPEHLRYIQWGWRQVVSVGYTQDLKVRTPPNHVKRLSNFLYCLHIKITIFGYIRLNKILKLISLASFTFQNVTTRKF